MPLLKSLTYRPPAEAARFPFTIPVIRTLGELAFTAPVTFFVGENGSGKSTLLEAIAAAAGLITVGSAEAHADPNLSAVRELGQHLRLTWSKRTRRGFFLRAEDFFGYAKRMNESKAELQRDLRAVDDEYTGRSETAKGLAKMPHARELADLQRRYGEGLDAQSHGESFLKLFQSRFVPGGLYLLDEPEAPLSPARQLALLAMLKSMVEDGAQFIIATHSPILLAFPGAVIFSFDAAPIQPVAYESLEHVTLMRAFLNNPEAYLRHL
ncbi:MAG: AAA family ATPase [Anaerolineales bacterium]